MNENFDHINDIPDEPIDDNDQDDEPDHEEEQGFEEEPQEVVSENLPEPTEDISGRYYTLLEQLEESGEGLGDRWENELQPQLDAEEITYEDAVEKLEDVISKREIAKLMHNFTSGDRTPERIEELRETIRTYLASMRAENFIGNGKKALVYMVDSVSVPEEDIESTGVCIKVIVNDEFEPGDNTIHEEVDILNELSGFEVDGVRSPEYIDYLSGGDLIAIIMEKLDAANLGRVMDDSITHNRDVLPDSFEFDSFFEDLKNYVNRLHEKGYYHLDLAARNIMVDNKTGKPRVIDFGKSKYIPLAGDRRNEDRKDRAGLESIKKRLKDFIAKLEEESEEDA